MSKTLFINGKAYVKQGEYAQAVYQEDGIIKAVGSNDEVLAVAAEDAEVIDCQGLPILPGLNDSHMHVAFLGTSLLNPEIHGCKSIEETIERCKKFLEENPETSFIYSMGLNEDIYTGEKKLPTRLDLDKISTEIPIKLARVDGHTAICNSYVFDHFDWQQFDEEHVNRFPDGTPTGRVAEDADFASKDAIPAYTKEEYKRAIEKALDYAASVGLTTCQSNDIGCIIMDHQMGYEALDELYGEGKGKVRYTSQSMYKTPELLKAYIEGPHFKESKYNDMFVMGPLKLLKDGSLGSRTAMSRKGYEDDPGNFGIENMTDEAVTELVDMASAAGLQCAIHCIGDGAIERVTKIYGDAAKKYPDKDLRHSIVHCQITDMDLLHKIKEANCIITHQPIFLECDLHEVEPRVGKELSKTSYAFKTCIELGIPSSYGSDCPVEDCNPFMNIYSAVTRKDLEGFPEGGWNPQECVTVEEAVDAMTIESAYHEFREDVKGRLLPGYYADIVVPDKDLFTCDPMEIKDIKPLYTMVGGNIVYKK